MLICDFDHFPRKSTGANQRDFFIDKQTVKLFCDGSYSKKRGVIGYAAVLICDGLTVAQVYGSELAGPGHDYSHTANLAEMYAAETALRLLAEFFRVFPDKQEQGKQIKLFSDSEVVTRTLNGSKNTLRGKWKAAAMRCAALSTELRVWGIKCAGHSKEETVNNLCDVMAYKAMMRHEGTKPVIFRYSIW